MGFTMASLLVHDDQVPDSVRAALRAASEDAGTRRRELLESAAEILHREAGLDCPDACELVDLPARRVSEATSDCCGSY
jgi:hypothetical protein